MQFNKGDWIELFIDDNTELTSELFLVSFRFNGKFFGSNNQTNWAFRRHQAQIMLLIWQSNIAITYYRKFHFEYWSMVATENERRNSLTFLSFPWPSEQYQPGGL